MFVFPPSLCGHAGYVYMQPLSICYTPEKSHCKAYWILYEGSQTNYHGKSLYISIFSSRPNLHKSRPNNFFFCLSTERTCCRCYIFKFRSHTPPGDSKFISWNIATFKVLNDRPIWNSASQDGPEFMAEDAKLFGYPFPYLYDEVWFSKF